MENTIKLKGVGTASEPEKLSDKHIDDVAARVERARAARSSVRSTARTYSHSSRSKHVSSRVRAKDTNAWSFKEKILLQGIVCGVLVAGMLFLNLIDNKVSTAITGWLSSSIGQNSEFNIAQIYAKATAALGIDGGENVKSVEDPAAAATIHEAEPEVTEYTPSIENTRIDEELLSQINGTAVEDDAKN